MIDPVKVVLEILKRSGVTTDLENDIIDTAEKQGRSNTVCIKTCDYSFFIYFSVLFRKARYKYP